MALFLASLPGCLEQRDGRRETALAVARRRGHAAIEELLLEAGARPEHASFHEGSAASPSSGGWGAGGGQEEAYCSWSHDERHSYRDGGKGGRSGGGRGRGPPPGLQGRGRGGGGTYGGRAPVGSPAAEQHEHGGQQQSQFPQRERCPW